jgi:hypothetical protein
MVMMMLMQCDGTVLQPLQHESCYHVNTQAKPMSCCDRVRSTFKLQPAFRCAMQEASSTAQQALANACTVVHSATSVQPYACRAHKTCVCLTKRWPPKHGSCRSDCTATCVLQCSIRPAQRQALFAYLCIFTKQLHALVEAHINDVVAVGAHVGVVTTTRVGNA